MMQPLPQSAMRASQADRERTVDVLKAAFAEGRLRTDEYHERLDRAQCAQTYGQLSFLVQDLPVGPMPTPFLPRPPASYGYAAPPWPPVRQPPSGAAATAATVLLVSLGTLVLTLLFLVAARHG